jgi:hypothetical protein
MEHDLNRPDAADRSATEGPAAKPACDASDEAESRELRGRSVLGSALFFSGIALLGLLLLDPADLPFRAPPAWFIDRSPWVVGGLIAVGIGWYLLGDPDTETTSEPAARGRRAATTGSRLAAERLGATGPRFTRLVLYTRVGCHLCEDAQALLGRYAVYLPPVIAVDIDNDPYLAARFSTCVPVVEIDGIVRFRGRVNELLLRRLIAATPPRDTTGFTEHL